jgi:hypothetical protein
MRSYRFVKLRLPVEQYYLDWHRPESTLALNIHQQYHQQLNLNASEESARIIMDFIHE